MFILTVLSLLGAVLNAKGRISGFYIWIVANVGWVIVDLSHGLYSQAILFAVYTMISVYGIIQWSRRTK